MAAAAALALWAPNLWWQAGHGWPQLAMMAVGTVAFHLRNVVTKVGVSSRTRLAQLHLT
jgi:hypothetical protein